MTERIKHTNKEKRYQRRYRGNGQLHDQLANMQMIDSFEEEIRPKSKSKSKSHRPKQTDHVQARALSVLEHVNVSCRFVIKSSSGYRPSTLDVDKPISSKQIWRVIYAPEECPVCLEICEVPRMLRCGHLMCLPCLINHSHYSKTPEICPICGDSIPLNSQRTTPVSFLGIDNQLKHKLQEGDETVFTLMQHPMDSTLALPQNIEPESIFKQDVFPGPEQLLYSRVCQASVEWAREELSKEVKSLIGAYKAYKQEFGEENGYTQAINEIKRSIQQLHEEEAIKTKHGKLSDDSFFYYQSCFESPTVYTLDKLDVSIMKAQYGSYDKFPSCLVAKIENITYTTHNKLSTKTNNKGHENGRNKALSHLPDQTPLAYIECDWTGIIDEDVLAKFSSKLDARRSLKARIAAKEANESLEAAAQIENQFKCEVAEALYSNSGSHSSSTVSIDTSLLPSLPSKKTIEKKPTQRSGGAWVDQDKEMEAVMQLGFVPKRGRKDMIIKF